MTMLKSSEMINSDDDDWGVYSDGGKDSFCKKPWTRESFFLDYEHQQQRSAICSALSAEDEQFMSH